MRNVLIISFFFNQTVAAVRLRGLAKYLPEFGWNPVILTVETSTISEKKFEIYETPYEDTLILWKKRIGLPLHKTWKEHYNVPTYKKENTSLDKLVNFWEEIFTWPDPTIDWSVSAIEKGDELLKERHFDAIISSISPITSHIIAKELVIRKKIPWVADFRDLWTQNHYYKYSRIRRFFEKRLELDTLSSANALTTISDPFSEKLKEFHKNKKVYTITNGFDPEQVNPKIPLTKKFSITYTGKIYKGRQDPEPLFRVLKALIDEKNLDPATIEVDFFGFHEGWLTSDIKKYHLENVVRLHGQISQEESVQKQRESHVLLLLTWNDPHEKGVYTAKLFEYLAAGRPILALGLQGSVVTDLLNQTHAGVNVSSDAEIKEQILTVYREYEKNGFVSYSGVPFEIEKYSHREMARKFAEVLEEICESEGS
jgi:glycosyltransferase involved in cell wall biosynthesis